jgi:hypothetical protein
VPTLSNAENDDLSDDEHRELATQLYERWEAGAPKSALEIEFWDDPTSHGKRFTSYVRRWLGRETERKSGQTEQIERLEALLRAHGLSPTEAGDLEEEYRLLAKARESALAALRVYNDPMAGFRTETFIVLMIIGWNSLFQAMLERDDIDYYVRDDEGRQVLINGRPRVMDTWELVNLALPGPTWEATRANLDFFLGLRNVIAHRYLPALDVRVASEAQSLLLNFERQLVDQFGEAAALGDRLSVPLQLSSFRNAGALESLKKAQAQLPTDVQDYLCRHREEVSDEVLRSPEYALQIFFVPITANRENSADATVNFIRPGDVTPELEEALQQLTVVTKPKRVAVASGDLLRPSEVVNLVKERLPFRFTSDTHQRAWKAYKVRPATASAEPEATEDRYCRWDRLMRGYGYTREWVELLVTDLSDPLKYEEVVGFPPEVR